MSAPTDRLAPLVESPRRAVLPSRAALVVLVTGVGVFMAFLDVTIVNVAFSSILADFPGVPLADVSWVVNAYNVVFAAMLVPAGRIADRIGRRRVFLAGLWLFVGASALCAAAPSIGVLISARALQAVGAAALLPASLGLVLREFAPASCARATSLWAATAAIAAAAGPSIGGVLVEAGGWRWAFLVNVLIALAVVPGRRVLVESREEDRCTPIDWPSVLALTVAVVALALGIVEAPDWGWGSARVLTCWLVAAILGAVVAARARRKPGPIVEPAVVRSRSFAVGAAATFGSRPDSTRCCCATSCSSSGCGSTRSCTRDSPSLPARSPPRRPRPPGPA